MIAVHHQNDILIVIAESVRQFLHEQIHLIDLVGIVFIRPPLFLGLVLRHGDRRIFDDLLRRILAVSLYGNGVDVIGSFCTVECIQDLLREQAVLSPVFRRLHNIVHVFQASERIESHVGKYFISIIERASVVMDRMRPIAQLLEIIRRRFTGLFCQDTLVRVFPRSEELGTDSGHDLKFHVGRSCTYRWNCQVSRGIFLHKFPEIRHRIFREFHIFDTRRIDKGFQLQINDVRLAFHIGIIIFSRCVDFIFSQFTLAEDPLYFFF